MTAPAGGVCAFSHLSVQVRDIDKVLDFYRDLLGLAVSIDRERTFTGPTPDGGRREFHRREVYLRWEDRAAAGFVVLGQLLDGDAGGGATELAQLGFDHVAFYVDDIDVVLDRARHLGAQIISGPNTHDGASYAYTGQASIRTALLRDPEDNIIQVDQWL